MRISVKKKKKKKKITRRLNLGLRLLRILA